MKKSDKHDQDRNDGDRAYQPAQVYCKKGQERIARDQYTQHNSDDDCQGNRNAADLEIFEGLPQKIVLWVQDKVEILHFVVSRAEARTDARSRPYRPHYATDSALRPRFSAICRANNSRSARMARKAIKIAPPRTVLKSPLARFWKIRSPSWLCPTSEVKAAIPTVVTVAMRIPATMTGSASGSVTRKSICSGFMPIARPTSINNGSIPFTAAAVLRISTSWL